MKVLVTALLLAAVGIHGGQHRSTCTQLVGDAARKCYAVEVSHALGAKPAGVEFNTSTVLLCPLHTRTGAWQ